MATATISKAEQKAQARAEYIKTALVIIDGDIALVKSQVENRYYLVRLDGNTALDCECGDYTYRHTHCKHQEAAELKVAAVAPAVEEVQPIVEEKAVKVKKPRRSAKNTTLCDELRAPEKVGIAQVRKACAKVPVDATKMTQKCPAIVTKPVVEVRKTAPQARKFQNKVAA